MKLLCISIALVAFCAVLTPAWSQIPRTLSYQGVLTDSLGVPKPDGTYSITFRLYNVASGGSPLWTEQKTLAVKRGLFSTILGDQVVIGSFISFDRPYWLGLQVASEPELSPRIPLTSVGYSFSSVRSDTAAYAMVAPGQAFVDSARIAGTIPNNSVTSAKIVDGTITNADIGNNAVTNSKIAVGQVVKRINGLADTAGIIGGRGITVITFDDTVRIQLSLNQDWVVGSIWPLLSILNTFASADTPVFVSRSASLFAPAAAFTKGTTALTNTNATMQMENFTTNGEGAWLRNASSSNVSPVVKLHQHPSSTASFMDGLAWDGVGAATRKFHITSAGTYVAGSDFAEAFHADGGKQLYEPGDVLVIAESGDKRVTRSARAYDGAVVGIYSTRPGVLGADKGGVTRIDENDIPVAIIGIVPTKVSTENGAISPGDLLVTSNLPGHAMKATPRLVEGVELYPSGTILGKALEGLESGTGVISVLVTLK